jgi:hypothetical protein
MAVGELTDAELDEIEKSVPWLVKTCAGLLRESPDTLDAYLTQVCSAVSVHGTRASAHCHVLGLDGNGRP